MPDSGQIIDNVQIPSGGGNGGSDRRVARTVKALRTAFTSLVLERNYRTISVADIAQRADVGRSTFYEHFSGKDEILLKSMDWMFATLAEAGVAEAPLEPLDNLIAHFWSNRRLARVVLAPPIEAKLRRALAAAVEERLAAHAAPASDPVVCKIAAVRIAASQLGLLEAWTRGELTASSEQIREAVAQAGRL